MKGLIIGLSLLSMAAIHSWQPASAEDGATPAVTACTTPPPEKGKSRQRFEAMAFMVVAAELESQGEKNFKLVYDTPAHECLAEQLQWSGLQVDATYNPWEKGSETMVYRFAGRASEETREVLVLYSGMVGIVAKGYGFHVSETRNGVISFYAMYREQPTFQAVKALASEIFAGTAKPLMAVRWPPGAAEAEMMVFDSTRLK